MSIVDSTSEAMRERMERHLTQLIERVRRGEVAAMFIAEVGHTVGQYSLACLDVGDAARLRVLELARDAARPAYEED